MQALFDSGRAMDIVLAVLALEGLWLIARGHAVVGVLLALLPGALMVVAARNALTGEAWPWIALPMAASFPAHLADLRRRRLARRLTSS